MLPPSVAKLEDNLFDVKALFKAKFFEDGLASRGAAPSLSRLEYNLSDVKALFKARFCEDVDDRTGRWTALEVADAIGS